MNPANSLFISIGEVVDSFISIALLCVTIVTTVKDVGFVVSMFASGIGIGNDIRGIVSAGMQRNCIREWLN